MYALAMAETERGENSGWLEMCREAKVHVNPWYGVGSVWTAMTVPSIWIGGFILSPQDENIHRRQMDTKWLHHHKDWNTLGIEKYCRAMIAFMAYYLASHQTCSHHRKKKTLAKCWARQPALNRLNKSRRHGAITSAALWQSLLPKFTVTYGYRTDSFSQDVLKLGWKAGDAPVTARPRLGNAISGF